MITFITPHQKRLIRKLFAPLRIRGLKNRDFSIISNNCFAGFVYDIYGLPYRTPTIGMYFYPDEYLKFVKNLKENLKHELEPLTFEDSQYKELLTKDGHQDALLGKVNGIEVVLLHYHEFNEAKEKWARRCKRVDFNNLVIKYSDQNHFEQKHYDEFKKLDYKNKLFFTSNHAYENEEYVYFIKKFENEGYAVDDLKSSRKVINYKKYLNSIKGDNHD